MGARGSPLPETAHSLPESPPATLSQVFLLCLGFNGHKPSPDEGNRRLAVIVINKACNASMGLRLPCSKAVCSLPGPMHPVPSQVLVPHPGFNGHKPSSFFIEGEGRLDKSVVNKINTSVLTHSPEPKMALAPFISKPTVMLRAPTPYPSPCPLRELLYMMGFKHRSHIVSMSCSWKEGSHAPEPHGVLHAHLSGSMLGKWLLWKLPNAKELKRHASHVVLLVISETSAAHSPKHICSGTFAVCL
jgi:hypothetical protein